jgi:transposase-like protein
MSRNVGLLDAVRRNPAIETRFWAKVNSSGDGCWLWTASTTGTGYKYGQFTFRAGGKQQHPYAHRVSWELTHGESIPAELNVCHRCDVPLCCNPAHLFLGTQKENLNDASAKGRLGIIGPHTRKLTPAQREQIFLMPAERGLVTRLAREYGVSKPCISVIRRGRFSRPASAPPHSEPAAALALGAGAPAARSLPRLPASHGSVPQLDRCVTP